jgi:hypothetical protein
MRNRIVGPHHAQQGGQSDKGWLNLDQIATVEVTSEDTSFPIEYVFGSNDGPGWRASQVGEQLIRIIFDKPVSVHRTRLTRGIFGRNHGTGQSVQMIMAPTPRTSLQVLPMMRSASTLLSTIPCGCEDRNAPDTGLTNSTRFERLE